MPYEVLWAQLPTREWRHVFRGGMAVGTAKYTLINRTTDIIYFQSFWFRKHFIMGIPRLRWYFIWFMVRNALGFMFFLYRVLVTRVDIFSFCGETYYSQQSLVVEEVVIKQWRSLYREGSYAPTYHRYSRELTKICFQF